MEENKFRVPAKFWTEERNLTWLLVALILDTFIVDPLVSVFTRGLAVSVINSTAFAVVLLLGLLTLTRHEVTQAIFCGDYYSNRLGAIRAFRLRRKLIAAVGHPTVNDSSNCICDRSFDLRLPGRSSEKTPHRRSHCRIPVANTSR